MAARALACVADVLGCMAEGRGGLRSGPAANPEWIQPFSYLECGDLVRGVEALAQEREKWLSRWVLISRNPLRSHLGKDLLMVGTQSGCSDRPRPPACVSVQLAVSPPVRPALLVRAARHYEGAEQILIRQAVMTAQHFVSTQPVELPAPGQWVVAECPARVDFSGESLG